MPKPLIQADSLVADRAVMGIEIPTLKERSDPVGNTSDRLRLEDRGDCSAEDVGKP